MSPPATSPARAGLSRVVVTGGAGFVGSHLCEALHGLGAEVICVDDLSTGSIDNLTGLLRDGRFHLLRHDVTSPFAVEGEVEVIFHFASPASPQDYLRLPLETLRVGSLGTFNCLELAREKKARLVLASTSEVYGDPLVHPQREDYFGNVSSTGPRAVYDEAKRFAEAAVMAYHRTHELDVGIVRIFNTYGPRLRPADGRVVSNFLANALRGEPLVIYGDGSQTRSFCYVDDLVSGVIVMARAQLTGPVNLGNPAEITIRQLAAIVAEVTGAELRIAFAPAPVDDPHRRRPDIGLARRELNFSPRVELRDGLARTAAWLAKATSPLLER